MTECGDPAGAIGINSPRDSSYRLPSATIFQRSSLVNRVFVLMRKSQHRLKESRGSERNIVVGDLGALNNVVGVRGLALIV